MLQVRHGPQIIVNAHACAANRGCCVCAPVARRRALARRWLRRVRPYYDAPGKADQFLVVSSPCQGCETGSMTAGHPTDSANPHRRKRVHGLHGSRFSTSVCLPHAVQNETELWRFSIADRQWNQFARSNRIVKADGLTPFPEPREYASIASAGYMFGGIRDSPAECSGSSVDELDDGAMLLEAMAMSQHTSKFLSSGLWQWRDGFNTEFYL